MNAFVKRFLKSHNNWHFSERFDKDLDQPMLADNVLNNLVHRLYGPVTWILSGAGRGPQPSSCTFWLCCIPAMTKQQSNISKQAAPTHIITRCKRVLCV